MMRDELVSRIRDEFGKKSLECACCPKPPERCYECAERWARSIIDLVDPPKEPYHPLAEQLETGHA